MKSYARFEEANRTPQQRKEREVCLQVLLGVKQPLMQLHNGCLLISAAPVSLHHALPQLPNLQPPRCDCLTMAQIQITQEESNAVKRHYHHNTGLQSHRRWMQKQVKVTGVTLAISSALVIAAKCYSVASLVAKGAPLLLP